MIIDLLKNNSDPKVIAKSIERIHRYSNAKLKENCSILNPVLTLTSVEDFADVNYAYIPEFKRYYFVDDIVTLNYNMIEVHCSVDVLYTYQANLMNTKFEWVRSYTLNSGLFPDPEWPLQSNKANINKVLGVFPHSTGNNYTLTVAGGA